MPGWEAEEETAGCWFDADPESRAHSENESVHLAELRNCCLNEAVLLSELAR